MQTNLFLRIKEKFFESTKLSLTVYQGNRFVHIKENFFESTKLSSIQRKFLFDHISKKCFFDPKKLSFGCKWSKIYSGIRIL